MRYKICENRLEIVGLVYNFVMHKIGVEETRKIVG